MFHQKSADKGPLYDHGGSRHGSGHSTLSSRLKREKRYKSVEAADSGVMVQILVALISG